MPCLRQLDAEARAFLREKAVRDLDQDAAAVAHLRVGADRAAVAEVLQHREPVLDDAVRPDVLHVGDEADAARILLLRGIVETLLLRQPGIAHDERMGGVSRDGALGA
jgi:hypothetical protein